MRLLAIETVQLGDYYVSRYEQVEAYGAQVSVLSGLADADHWPADRFRVAQSQHIGDLIALAVRWHQDTPFDGVFTFAESSVIAAAAVAEALGLPGIGVDAAQKSRNKFLMRLAHEAHGAAHPPFQPVGTLDEAQAAAVRIGYPVILKPTLGAGSSFVFRVDSPGELARAFPQAWAGIQDMGFFTSEVQGLDLGPNGLLIEGFLDGREYLIEALCWDGQVTLGSIVDRVTVESATFDDDVHHAPTDLDDATIERVRQVVERGAVAQGLHRSVLHAEVRFHHGEPFLLEIAARPGGGGLDHMARISAGYCPIQSVIAFAVGERPAHAAYQRTARHTAAMVLLCPAGTIEAIHVPEDVRQDPALFFLKILARPGDVIRRPPAGNSILGFAGSTGTSFEDAMANAERAAQAIDVTLTEAVLAPA